MVRLRLTADTRQELEQAITELREQYGQRVTGLRVPAYPGRRGDWLCYGELLDKAPASNQPQRVIVVDRETGEILKSDPD